MFFQGNHKNRHKRKEDTALPAKESPNRSSQERASSCISLKAGLTVEAACILPVFLWAVLGACYFIELTQAQVRLVGAVRDTARKMAMLSYVFYNEDTEKTTAGEIIEGVLSLAYAKTEILKKAELEETAIGDEVKITLAGSDLGEEIIDLRIMSAVRIPVPLYRERKLRFMERGRVRAWTGRSPTINKAGSSAEKETEMVYVTANGSVYHTDSNCSYIRVAVKSAAIHTMDNRRNENGEKYYPCSCYREHTSNTVYFTKYGNRYHSSNQCSSLKRTVRKVALSSVEGMKHCSKCG